MKEFITAVEAASRLKVSARWLAKLCQEGRILGAQKPGRDWLIPVGAKIEPLGSGRPLKTLEIPKAKPGKK